MIVYKITYSNIKTNFKSFNADPVQDEPDFILTTDFSELGIITEKVGNHAMIEAIEAVSMITNCEVLTCKRV